MPRSRHWLDPMARRVLQFMGDLPPDAPRPPAEVPAPDAEPPSWRIDVNRASAGDWLLLPGCSNDQAELLVRLQRGGVQLSGPEDLARLLDLSSQQLERWRPHLLFRWYSEPPVVEQPPLDLNRATDAQLQELGLSEARRQRLRSERRKAPFRDLADLQERLVLPPEVVESLIGRTSFEPIQRRQRSTPELPRPA